MANFNLHDLRRLHECVANKLHDASTQLNRIQGFDTFERQFKYTPPVFKSASDAATGILAMLEELKRMRAQYATHVNSTLNDDMQQQLVKQLDSLGIKYAGILANSTTG